MASLKVRDSTFYIQFYSGGKQRRVKTDTVANRHVAFCPSPAIRR